MSNRWGLFAAGIGFTVFVLACAIVLMSIFQPRAASFSDTPGNPRPANLPGIIWGSAGIFVGSVLIIVGLREVYPQGTEHGFTEV
jgi:hypothetical protein